MEIKELIPKSKEIIIQPKMQEGIFFDAFSYTIENLRQSTERNGNGTLSVPNGPAERGGKSHLYIISQVKSNDTSLDYVPNLIASFIKRELESGNSSALLTKSATGLASNNPYEFFENSLKKTNELIDGLLKNNNDLKLDVGIAFINKEKMSASKIGKAKMLAYRPQNEETFDVFENDTEFNKLHIDDSKRFSNIIYGEVKKDDRFFFFIPNNRLNPKQKLIISTLCKSESGEFLDQIHKIISPEKIKKNGKGPTPCCGVYFEIKEEAKKVIPEPPQRNVVISGKGKEAKITGAEVAKINKDDTLKKTAEKFKDMVIGENSNKRNWRLIKPRGMNNYFIVTVMAVVFIATLFLLTGRNPKLKEEVASINERLRVSESKFILKENYEARKSLAEAFKELNLLGEGKQKNEVLLAAAGLLNRIEKINIETKPSILLDLTTFSNLDSNKLNNVLVQSGKVFVNDSEKIYSIQENEAKTIEGSDNVILSWIKNNKIIVLSSNIKIIDLEENKINELRKRFSFEPMEMKNYEDNLYFLGPKNIYKITNALVRPGEELEWLKPNEAEKLLGNFTAIDLDSNIYVLTDERKMAVLFKGELIKLIDLDFEVQAGTKLATLNNNEFLVIDKEVKLARVIDDLGGLKTSYDLSDIDTIKDVFFEKESRTLYILSPFKIWQLKL